MVDPLRAQALVSHHLTIFTKMNNQEQTTDQNIEYAPDYPTPDNFTTKVEGYWKGCTFVAFFQSKNSRGNTVTDSNIDHITEHLDTDGFVRWISDRIGDMEDQGLTDILCTGCQVIPPYK